MIMVPAGIRVLVATKPVDFRRGADSLAALVREQLRHDPFSGTIFIFRSKRADRLKILAWDGSGLALFWKRLEPADQRRRDAAHCVAACCPCRRIGLVAPACARRPASDGCIMRCCD
jgi:transposase